MYILTLLGSRLNHPLIATCFEASLQRSGASLLLNNRVFFGSVNFEALNMPKAPGFRAMGVTSLGQTTNEFAQLRRNGR
jgi:hypothetical protein